MSIVCITTILFCFQWYGKATNVITFHEKSLNIEKLSSVSATNVSDESLPEHFLICSSHRQQQIDTPNTRTIYVLYEDSNFTKPWLSIGFHVEISEFVLWANTNFNYWYDLGTVTREAFLNWIHICVDVNVITGTLRASVNGGNVTTVGEVEGLIPIPKLYLRLGIVHESYYGGQHQFIGSVANINIYTMTDIIDEDYLASSSTCTILEKTMYLTWANIKWNLDAAGDGVNMKSVDGKSLCMTSTVLNFNVPSIWKKIEATKECKKYGNAILSKPPAHVLDIKNITDDFIKNIYGQYFDQCESEYFWTSLTDEYLEGSFIDEITNESIRYLKLKHIYKLTSG